MPLGSGLGEREGRFESSLDDGEPRSPDAARRKENSMVKPRVVTPLIFLATLVLAGCHAGNRIHDENGSCEHPVCAGLDGFFSASPIFYLLGYDSTAGFDLDDREREHRGHRGHRRSRDDHHGNGNRRRHDSNDWGSRVEHRSSHASSRPNGGERRGPGSERPAFRGPSKPRRVEVWTDRGETVYRIERPGPAPSIDLTR